MSSNKQLLREFFTTVVEGGDLNAVDRFFLPTVVNHMAPAGMQEGLDALRMYHGGMSAAFSDIRVEVLQQVEEGAVVMSYLRSSGTHTGPLGEIAATGKRPTMSVVRIDRFEDGKIAEHWSVSDFAAVLAQLAG
jgi:predicted ester cyclase